MDKITSMTGFELLEKLTVRDFSGSEDDLYAQLLMTIFGHIHGDIFPLLLQAEKEGKRLGLREVTEEELELQDQIVLKDVILVDGYPDSNEISEGNELTEW